MADFLEEVFPEEAAPPPIDEPTPEPEPVAEAVAPEPVAPEPQPEPEAPKPGYIPIAALMDERDKRKAADERIRELESRQSKPVEMPDPYDDPTGFAERQQQIVDERVNGMRFEMSDRFARQQHGGEATDAAIEWAKSRAQADPVFAASYMREQDPIGWIVQQHKRDGLLSQIGDRSLDDFVRAFVAENGDRLGLGAPVAATAQPVASQQQALRPAAPPRSIASDAAPASSAPTDAAAEFNAIFTR